MTASNTPAVAVKARRSLSLPAITLTVDAVREGLSDEAILRHASELGKVQDRLSSVQGEVMYFAALETFAVVDGGKIGKGKGKGTLAEGALWATKGDYAQAIGKAPSYLTQLANMGRAVVVHGAAPGDSERHWDVLSRFGGMAAVTRAVEQESTDLYREAMDTLVAEYDREGKILSDDKRAARIAAEQQQATEQGDGSTEGDGGDATETERQSAAVTVPGGDLTVKQLCDLLAVKVAQMDREQYGAFEDWCDKVRAANVKRLAKAEAKATASA